MQTAIKRPFIASPRELRQNADLAIRLTIREFEARYRGNILGVAWSLLTPILTALVFTFVFTKVFQSRWVQGPADPSPNFTVVLLTGMVVHAMFAECISRAPGLVLAHASYVKKVVFPLSVLPIVVVAGATINAMIGLLVVALVSFVAGTGLPLTAPLAMAVLAVLAFFNLALVFLVAALGVYLRDIGQFVGFVITATMFLTPIFYPLSAVPPKFRAVMQLNPLTAPVEAMREALIFGRVPDVMPLALLLSGSLLALMFSLWIFQRLRPGFSDVI